MVPRPGLSFEGHSGLYHPSRELDALPLHFSITRTNPQHMTSSVSRVPTLSAPTYLTNHNRVPQKSNRIQQAT